MRVEIPRACLSSLFACSSSAFKACSFPPDVSGFTSPPPPISPQLHPIHARYGSALTGMLDNVKVESYGSMATLGSVAQASMKGPQLIVLTVYDPGVRAFRLSFINVF